MVRTTCEPGQQGNNLSPNKFLTSSLHNNLPFCLKVPAITYGGPIVPPDNPSPESIKIAESLVILEFIADISKPGTLLPTDPVLRAKARFFIDTVSNTIGTTFVAVTLRGEPMEKVLASVEKIQSLLPPEGYAVGPEFTIADAAVVPFFARLELILEEDIGAFDVGVGPKTLQILNTDPKFARFRKYFAAIKARESFKKTFDRALAASPSINAVLLWHFNPCNRSIMAPSNRALTGQDIREVARAAVAALNEHSLRSCLFGSTACAIYGTQNREPNVSIIPPFTLSQIAIMAMDQDVDIIVISNMDPEDIKELIISTDNRFYLVPSANRRNTYQVLWFRVSNRKKCKVDILVPGLLSIPRIPLRQISYIQPFEDIPVVPLLVLLLLKLRGWTDHRVDYRQYMLDKVEVDEEDIEELLRLAVENRAHLNQEQWLPKWFVREMRERVDEYIEEWPSSEGKWTSLGL
ncbi:hypothetical protein C0993_008329 [Termitomyces sp. T159_Od127]|nr:hypothetical protein C0993_008329 [Termitomyces sp. T159_Od127]